MQSIIANTLAHSPVPPVPKSSTPVDLTLRQQPISFLADTDSIDYDIDTGANRIIVNDVNLLSNFVPSKSSIKGIGGQGVQTMGSGQLSLRLTTDSGFVSHVHHLHAVLVPSSPYNLISPHAIIPQMRAQGYTIQYFHHDDLTYVWRYKPKEKKRFYNLTVPISKNKLFHL